MKEFLESHQYKMWKEDFDIGLTTYYFQKRIDTLHKYVDIALCETNDKVFINIEYYDFNHGNYKNKSCQIYLVHKNKNGDWCDLKIYSIPVDKMKENLQSYEDKIVNLWKEFAK